METFFFVILPGSAIALGVIILLAFIIFAGIPKVKSLKYRNAQSKNTLEIETRLQEARLILALLSKQADDDSMLEVQLGSKCIKEINNFLNDTKQLGR